MHVLSLTNAERTFYRQQVRVLREQGVEHTELMVPGREGQDDDRSATDYLRFWPTVAREVSREYDVVHANYGLLAPMALTQRTLPVVLSVWGTDLYGPFGWLTKACAPFCDAVIVMSEAMNAEFDRECDVIPHGVDLDRFSPIPRSEARERVGWDDSARHVLFPYPRWRDVKNYPLADRVTSAAQQRVDADVRLETVSGVSQTEFVAYLNAADSLLLTSRYEGSPNVVKEAMACNVPVVSTDVGDVGERLANVENSAVRSSEAELVDALVSVLERDERSDGRAAVRDISLERTGQRFRDVYERVTADDGQVERVPSASESAR